MTTKLTAPLLHPRLRPAVTSPWLRAGVAASAFLVAGIMASDDDGTILCPLRRCSGGYCPGCGLTRSTGQLLRGDLAGSWRQHPFLLLALGQMALLLGVWGMTSEDQHHRLRRLTTTFVVANMVLLCAIWVVRLAAGTIPIPFG